MAEFSMKDLATKRDLENFKIELRTELKHELRNYVTKEEFREALSKVATRESVEVLANQVMENTNDISEIKNSISNIEWQVGGIKKDIHEIKNYIQTKFEAIMNAVDSMSKQLVNEKTEKMAIDHSLNRHEQRIDDHETRIKKLERKSA